MAASSNPLDVIEKRITRALKQTGAHVAWQLEQAYYDVITKFYGAYNPKPITWKLTPRTYNLFTATNAAKGEKIYHMTSKTSCYCELRVDASYISGEPYAKQHGWKIPNYKTKDDILEMSWGGSHGGYGTTTPPKDMMDKKFDQIKSKINSVFAGYFRGG